ncbi:hypothetical protein IAR50_003689 [Cryptococcus sp. DSM 104548]
MNDCLSGTSVVKYTCRIFYLARALWFPVDGPVVRTNYMFGLGDQTALLVRQETFRDKEKWASMTALEVSELAHQIYRIHELY